jgi:hypothetical protein
MDRNYPSYRMLAELTRRERHFVIRCSAASFGVARRMLHGEGPDSQVATLTPCAAQASLIGQLGLPQTLTVRLVRLRLSTGEWEVLVTSLCDEAAYPTAAFLDLYHWRWGVEIDQPYNLHKSHLLAMSEMVLGPNGGAPRLELCQVPGVGVDQPERTGRMGDLATPQPPPPQPGKQGRLRHVQAMGQLGEGPLVGATLENRRRRGRGAQPQANLEVANHGGVEGLTPFGRMPALGVQLPRDRRRAVAVGVQRHHPGRELRVVTQLVQPGDWSAQGRLGAVAAEPMHLDVDPLALAAHGDHHPLDQLSDDRLTIHRRGGRRLPEGRDLGGEPPDRGPLLGGQDWRLLGLAAGVISLQGGFSGQRLFPLAFQGARRYWFSTIFYITN